MKILALDPSSTCTGWAISIDSKIVNAGMIKPAKGERGDPAGAVKRVRKMVKYVTHLIDSERPDKAIVEAPNLHVHRSVGVKAQGLPIYGFAVGAIWNTCFVFMNEDNVETITASEWTQGKGKAYRKSYAKIIYSKYERDGHWQNDKGGDMSDAICLAEWFGRRLKIRELTERGLRK